MISPEVDDDGAAVGQTLLRALDGEPPLTLLATDIARCGARRLRRRRAVTVGGAVLAVATLTAGIAVSVPRLAGSIGPADTRSVQVPGCTTVVSTDDPAVTAWRDGTAAIPAGPPSSIDTGASSSFSASVPTAGTTAPTAGNTAPTAGTTAPATGTGATDTSGPRVPEWLTASKAARMAAAFSAAIPAGVHLSAADASAQAGPLPFAAGSGVAGGGVVVSAGAARAYLTVSVQTWDRGAPPCTANLAHRYTSPDGSITDVIDEPGTSETGHYLLAESFRPDGTLVDVGLNVSGGIVPPTTSLPLTVRQLAVIAALPELAITAG